MRILAALAVVLFPAAAPLHADYTYSILEHYVWGDFTQTYPEDLTWPCTQYNEEHTQLVQGTCRQSATIDNYTNWGWVDLAGMITSPYPPGPWIEGPSVKHLLQQTITTQSFSYQVDEISSIEYQIGMPLLEQTKFDYPVTRTRYPQPDPPPDPDPPIYPEPATWLTAGTAIIAGCVGVARKHHATR